MQFIFTLILVELVTIGQASILCPEKCLCDKKMRVIVQCSNLTSVPETLPRDTEYLSIANSSFETLDSSNLKRYAKLSELYVMNTPLKTIKLTSGMGNLRMLLFQSTAIKTVDSMDFVGAPNLIGVGISNSELTSISINKGFQRLKFLTLYGNKLENLNSSMFGELPQLERLGLQKNRIKSISLSTGYKNLRYLSLDNNLLTSFDSVNYESAENLEKISLVENQISTAKATNILPNLKQLTLKCNEITNVASSSIIKNLPQLKKLELKNCKGVERKNKITCDCNIWKLSQIEKVSGYCKNSDNTRLKISKIEKDQITCKAIGL